MRPWDIDAEAQPCTLLSDRNLTTVKKHIWREISITSIIILFSGDGSVSDRRCSSSTLHLVGQQPHVSGRREAVSSHIPKGPLGAINESKGYSSILVRLTTYLQKVNQLHAQTRPYNTTPPWNGRIESRPGIRAGVSVSKRFNFLGIPRRMFFQFDMAMGKVAKVYYWWTVGFEPTTPFVNELRGYCY